MSENKNLSDLKKDELLELATQLSTKLQNTDAQLKQFEEFYKNTFQDDGERKSYINQINTILPNLQKDLADTASIKSEIEIFKIETLQGNGKESTKAKIDGLVKGFEETVNNLKGKNDEIIAAYNILLKDEAGKESINAQILKIKEDFSKNLTENSTQLNELKSLHELIFGNEQKKIIGTKQRLESYEEEIKEKQNLWQQNADTLFKKIEGLLPGATVTGLAKAYQDQRRSYIAPYWLWALVFVLTMFGTMWFAIEHLKDASSIEDAFMKVISRLPFLIPAFWLAIFASKQQSQNKRLQQEYAYKEALTKSYEADKREIEKLPDSAEKNKLSLRLLEIMIEMAKNNPSETLGGKEHNDEPPSMMEILKIKFFKKIMGKDIV